MRLFHAKCASPLLLLLGCYPEPVEQCDQYREVLCMRYEDCDLDSRATCEGAFENEIGDCDDVLYVGDPRMVDLCIQDMLVAECEDIDAEHLSTACDSTTFYFD